MVWHHPTGSAAQCSPVGLVVSGWFSGMSDDVARATHQALWWLHSALVFGFIMSIPYTRLMHTIAGPLNLFLAPGTLGKLVPLSMEEVEKTERIGVSAINHFDQQQLLSLDACMECGRCEEACPAFATDKPLSPKKVVQDLKALMGLALANSASAPALHGQTIQLETLWSCTACTACVRVCPVR